MAFCVKCGADNDPNTTKLCRSCGTPLPVANPGVVTARPPAAAVPPKKRHPVLTVVLIIFVGMVALAYFTRSPRPEETKTASAPLIPTPVELKKARDAGLSKEFANEAWISHRYAMNTYSRLTGLGTDEGITLPSDEAIRDSILKLKDVAHTDADKVAFQRLSALMWATHMATQLKGKGTEDPTYKLAYRVADDCFSATNTSFEGGTGGAVANAVRRCTSEKSQAKAELDSKGIANWNDF